ncbi:MAG: hypothetical protein ACKV2T_04530 [Kofleriaceae bacterium]
MTEPVTPTAKSIAKQLDRRQMRRRLLFLALVVGAIIAAITFLTCGQGFGLGGKGKGSGAASGSGPGSALTVDAGPKRCAIRIAAAGSTVDGQPATVEQIVAACKSTTGADVTVTGDARQGDWDTLRAALEAAEVAIDKK